MEEMVLPVELPETVSEAFEGYWNQAGYMPEGWFDGIHLAAVVTRLWTKGTVEYELVSQVRSAVLMHTEVKLLDGSKTLYLYRREPQKQRKRIR